MSLPRYVCFPRRLLPLTYLHSGDIGLIGLAVMASILRCKLVSDLC